MNNGYPLWATPERRAKLAELFAQQLPNLTTEFYQSLDRVIFGDMSISEYLDMLTRNIGHDLIENWKEDDREERSDLWQREKRRLHASLRIKRRGPFDTIRREQYLAERPVFKVVGRGVSAFTQHRVAKVLLPELNKTVWIDLSGVSLSKSRLRKLALQPEGLARRGGKAPTEIQDIVKRGVRRYL